MRRLHTLVILCDTSIEVFEDQLSKIRCRLAKVLLEMLHGDMLLDVGMGSPNSTCISSQLLSYKPFDDPGKAIGRIKNAYHANLNNTTRDDSLVAKYEGSINVIDDTKTDLRTDHLLKTSAEAFSQILQKNRPSSLEDHQEILHQMESEHTISISNVSNSGPGSDIVCGACGDRSDISKFVNPKKEYVRMTKIICKVYRIKMLTLQRFII